MIVDREKAAREAKRRWGRFGDAWLHWSPTGGMVCRVGLWRDKPLMLGEGRVWDDAFLAASKPKPQSKLFSA